MLNAVHPMHVDYERAVPGGRTPGCVVEQGTGWTFIDPPGQVSKRSAYGYLLGCGTSQSILGLAPT